MNALIAVLLAVCFVLPACYLAAALPALWLAQNTILAERAALLKMGGVDVTLVDLVLVLLMAKFALSVVLTRQLAADRPLYLAIAFYLGVNVLASVAAGAQFGNPHMLRSFIALARLLSEIAIVPILAQSIATLPQARRCGQIVLVTLVVLGVIQFVNFFSASRGFVIGEVQGMERGELRYFGPVGDSVGFVLLLGYLAALCAGRLAGVLLFAGGIVLTAGLGAFFGAGVATLLFAIFGLPTEVLRGAARKTLWIVPLALFAVALVASTVARPMVTTLVERLSTGKYRESASQRMASTSLGVRMILANPVLGVGFMGYAAALPHYGGRQFFDLSKENGGTANANNQLIQTLTDAGLCGLLSVIALVGASLHLFMKLARSLDDPLLTTLFRAAFIWLLAQVLGNMAAVWIVPSSYIARLLWVLLGLGVAVARISTAAGSTANAKRQTPDYNRGGMLSFA